MCQGRDVTTVLGRRGHPVPLASLGLRPEESWGVPARRNEGDPRRLALAARSAHLGAGFKHTGVTASHMNGLETWSLQLEIKTLADLWKSKEVVRSVTADLSSAWTCDLEPKSGNDLAPVPGSKASWHLWDERQSLHLPDPPLLVQQGRCAGSREVVSGHTRQPDAAVSVAANVHVAFRVRSSLSPRSRCPFFPPYMVLFLASLGQPRQRTVTATTSLSHCLLYPCRVCGDRCTNRLIYPECDASILQKETPSQPASLTSCKAGSRTAITGPTTLITTHSVPMSLWREQKNLTCGFY